MPNSNYDVLLLDVSNMFHSAFSVVNFINDKGEELGAVYGMLNQIQSLIRWASPSEIVAVFDGKGSRLKKRKIYPAYKAGKAFPINLRFATLSKYEDQLKQSENSYKAQLVVLNDFLNYLPIKKVVVPEYEADEIIAFIARKYYGDKTKVICSNDKDYHQLVNDKCIIRNRDKMITPDELVKIWGTNNGRFITVLRSIIGDKSDKINGVKGVALKSIQKFFSEIFESYKVETIQDLKQFLEYVSNRAITEKVSFAKNWKTIYDKSQYILHGRNPSEEETILEVLERNYKLMDLLDSEISTYARQVIMDSLQDDVTFSPNEYKIQIIKRGLHMNGSSALSWEMQFRDLVYKANKDRNI